jgi:peptidoglycan/xylan/chitin deacetylase (PgdA/CDA1 family)
MPNIVHRLFHLTFHGLGAPARKLPPGEENYWVDPPLFAAVLDQVAGRDDVRITFDDSYESDYAIALPLLAERKLKARFFVVADRVDQKGCLSTRQIRSMCAQGMAIENHGMRHRRWKDLSRQDLHEELVVARDRLQQVTGAPVTEAACPFGSYNRRAFQMLREQGYQRVYTSDGGSSAPDAWVQPRITVLRSHGLNHVLGMIDPAARGKGELWRDIKMTLKRLR